MGKEADKTEKFLEELIERGMGQLMDQSRDSLMAEDKIYLADCRKEEEAELRLAGMGLSETQKAGLDEYLDCARIANHRYADISYMAGIRDTIQLLVSLGVLKGVDMEE